MTTDYRKIQRHLQGLLAGRSVEQLSEQLLPSEDAMSARLIGASRQDAASISRRWQVLGQHLPCDVAAAQNELLDERTRHRLTRYEPNIENFIGTAEIPVGLAGPLRVCGLHAHADYYVPLATTEAALVASCTRGAQVLSLSGGCRCAVIGHGVLRSPGFAFDDIGGVGRFVLWVTEHIAELRAQAEATTRHGKLADLRINVEGNHVYLICEFTTGDASGQNMVTIATEAMCNHIANHCPIKPRYWFVEANMSGDKKASSLAFGGVRGRKVVAEATIDAKLIERRMHTTVNAMCDYWRMSSLGGVMSGIMGVQGHYANVLAAMYLALGQDVACVAESAVGVTRFEATGAGGLYVAVTLPAIMVGTIGGGTGLPSAQACLRLLNLPEDHAADALAEVVAAMVLAGEVSIIGALAAGQFTQAHEQLARDRRDAVDDSRSET